MKTAILTRGAPVPSSPLSQAIACQGFVFVSGQGPIDPATGIYEKADIRTETRRVLENMRAVLAGAGVSMAHVVKVNVYLRDMQDFPAMNEIYGEYFTAPFPARTTIQAAALPRGFGLEIDCTAHL